MSKTENTIKDIRNNLQKARQKGLSVIDERLREKDDKFDRLKKPIYKDQPKQDD